MIEKISPYINNSLIETLPFYKINKRLTNFTTYQIAVSTPPDITKTFNVNFDFEAILLNQIRQEINLCVYRHINNKLRSTTKIDYFDLIKYRIDELQIYDSVFSHINKYKNAILNTRLSSKIQNGSKFIYSSPDQFSNKAIYKIGKIGNTNIWVDHNINYDNDKIVLFDEVEINFDIKFISIMDDHTFSPKIVIEVNLCVGNVDSMIVSIIEGMSSPSYAEYISTRRGTKIDEIIK